MRWCQCRVLETQQVAHRSKQKPGREWVMACMKEPAKNSPGVISGNHGKPKPLKNEVFSGLEGRFAFHLGDEAASECSCEGKQEWPDNNSVGYGNFPCVSHMRAEEPLYNCPPPPFSPIKCREFSHVGIMQDDAAGRWVFSGISRFPHLFILVLLHTHLNHHHRLSGPHCIAAHFLLRTRLFCDKRSHDDNNPGSEGTVASRSVITPRSNNGPALHLCFVDLHNYVPICARRNQRLNMRLADSSSAEHVRNTDLPQTLNPHNCRSHTIDVYARSIACKLNDLFGTNGLDSSFPYHTPYDPTHYLQHCHITSALSSWNTT
ncbi:hypothetical protein PR048_009811 [Dryococelus australis]|uniref:Uncharacterized protein n=1 Tax=Dryococelus australis TaxID=614101 RepID=A0ABQ9I2T7_9NEOP|nr:hypothetical protein PR048_009811 [Dryococelus australis]